MTETFLILIAFAFGAAIDIVLRRQIRQYARYPIALLLSAAIVILTCVKLNGSLPLAKGLLLAESMIAISLYDSFTHEIPNLLLLPVLAVGFIGFTPLSSVFGMLLASIPFLIVSLKTRGGIGGGDIKLMAALGFALGAPLTFVGALTGMIAFMPFGIFSRFHNKKITSYALAPWLCSGCFFAFLLGGSI